MRKIIDELKKIKEKIDKTKYPIIIYIFIVMIIIMILPYILPLLILCTPFLAILLILYVMSPKNNNINNLKDYNKTNHYNNHTIDNNSLNNIDNSKENIRINHQSNYNVNNNPMTKTELYFHKNLKLITDKYNLIIIPQLQLQRIFKVTDKNDITAFNKIKAKSIDFAIVDENYNYKLFIELDDYTHKYISRIERDDFINNLFKDNGLTLLRIKASNYYNRQDLELKIKEIIKKEY